MLFIAFQDYDLDQLRVAYPPDEGSASINTVVPHSAQATAHAAISPSDTLLAVSPLSEEEDDSDAFIPRPSRSHRRGKQGHIPRPSNAFMLFRSDLCAKEKLKSIVERDNCQISRIAGHLWNKLSERDRAPYKRRAEAEKKRHAKTYPGYKYAPIYRTKGGKRKTKQDFGLEVKRCKQLADMLYNGVEGNELEKFASEIDDGVEGSHASASSETSAPLDCATPTSFRASYATAPRQCAAPSRSRRTAAKRSSPRRHTTRRSLAPAPMSPAVKLEAPSTPELSYPPQFDVHEPFVSTEHIPYLDLDGTLDQARHIQQGLYPWADQHMLHMGTVPLSFGNNSTLTIFNEDSALITASVPSLSSSPCSSLSSISPHPTYAAIRGSLETGLDALSKPSFGFNDPWYSAESSLEQQDYTLFNLNSFGNSQVSPLATCLPILDDLQDVEQYLDYDQAN